MSSDAARSHGERGGPWWQSLSSAVLVALVGCRPVLYELHDSATGAEPATDSGTDSLSSEPGTGTFPPPQPTSTEGPVELCFDGVVDGDETDIDCGGSCPPCEPGAKCVEPKDCSTGACVGGLCGWPAQCRVAEDCPQDVCRKAMCEAGQCHYFALDGLGCDDGQSCTDLDVCIGGECSGVPRDCSGFEQACQHGFCNPATGNCAVEFLGDGEPCEDGLACTVGDFCVQGACTGKPAPLMLFSDFNDPGGWLIDPPWMIGPAMPSDCDAEGHDDPPDDHSFDETNLLAGAAIGGCLPFEPVPEPMCLTSPPLDLQGPEPVILQYWSQLSVAQGPGGARIEVWSGKVWETLFDTQGEAFAEEQWTLHTIDLTTYANFMLLVRFCHHQPDPGPLPAAGWSVDDVYIGPPECQPP